MGGKKKRAEAGKKMRDLMPETWNAVDPRHQSMQSGAEEEARVDNFVNIHAEMGRVTRPSGSCTSMRAWFARFRSWYDDNFYDDSGFQFVLMNKFAARTIISAGEGEGEESSVRRRNQSLMNRSHLRKLSLENFCIPIYIIQASPLISYSETRKSSQSHKTLAWVERDESFH